MSYNRCMIDIGPVALVSFRVGEDLRERIRVAAEADRRTMSNWIALACEEKLDRDERRRGEQPGR
jgi:predicted transcriptional regulator